MYARMEKNAKIEREEKVTSASTGSWYTRTPVPSSGIVSTKNLFATSDNQYSDMIALAFSNNFFFKHNLLFSECVFVEHLNWL